MKTLNRTEVFQKVPFPHPQRASQWALMFINTGRCFQNAEKRFRDIGFNGYICGTNLYCGGREILHAAQTHKTNYEAFKARSYDLPMLTYLPNSAAMGNAAPESLFDIVSHVTAKTSEDGISLAKKELGFI